MFTEYVIEGIESVLNPTEWEEHEGDTFTQDDIDSGRLTYRHDGSEAGTYRFSFAAVDENGERLEETEFIIEIIRVNHPPTFTLAGDIIVGEDSGPFAKEGFVSPFEADQTILSAPLDEAPSFMDVDAMPDWAVPEVAAAVRAGIIKGMPDGSFKPDLLVTRAEMAAMLARALVYAGLETVPGDYWFSDQADIPDWAVDQVMTAVRYGLIMGYPDGRFQTENTTTRAEAAAMLYRLLQAVAK